MEKEYGLNDREAGKIMVSVVNNRRVFSRIVTGHCDLMRYSKLSWSLAIDQIIVMIDVKSLWGYC